VPKLLLVEDNEMNRDMLARRLQRRGFDIVFAMDGKQAVARAQADQPDLILMDLSLPVMDGWEATVQIKDNSATSSIPVIALTAHALESDREKALSIGCDKFQTKPVVIDSLLAAISELLER
jgi:CheY-like chemotaxis protein